MPTARVFADKWRDKQISPAAKVVLIDVSYSRLQLTAGLARFIKGIDEDSFILTGEDGDNLAIAIPDEYFNQPNKIIALNVNLEII